MIATMPVQFARSGAGKTPDRSLLDVTNESPELAVADLIRHAIDRGASDLFFTPNEQHVAVSVRHLGIIRPIAILPNDQAKRCVAMIKANASMDTTEKRRPADGRWIFERGDGSVVDLRISAIPTLHGEDLALRILSRDSRLFVLENLGMAPGQFSDYQTILEGQSGLILISGPTGSGKTATLYSSLVRLANGASKINTIENPIEYAIEGLRQSQVNPMTGLTFAELLRGVLRQSPDVIMIGEVRDAETAQTAVHAANSGVLVFATVHSPAGPGAIQSMLSYGVNPQFLAASLRGVVAQRLVRTLCPDCRVSFDISDGPMTFEEIRPLLAPDQGQKLWAAAGCDKCDQSGYTGRTGVFEVMPISSDMRRVISDARPARDIREVSLAEKMLTFRQAALLKVATGQTCTEELFRVIPPEQLLSLE